MRFVLGWVAIVIAAALASWLARARFPIGIDFEGGGRIDARATSDAVRARIGDTWKIEEGNEVELILDNATLADANAIVTLLRAPGLGLFAVAPTGRTVRSIDGEDDVVVAEPPLLGPTEIREVRALDQSVILELGNAARLLDVTRRHVGERIALVLGDELVLKATVHAPISGGALQIDVPRSNPDMLALRLRTGIGSHLAGAIRSRRLASRSSSAPRTPTRHRTSTSWCTRRQAVTSIRKGRT